MALRAGQPVTFHAVGCSDTADSTNAFPGAMRSLKDLVRSPDTADSWVPRTASIQKTNFADVVANPAYETCQLVVGNLVYGMLADGSGLDTPFVFNLLTNAFLPITNIQQALLPNSPPRDGPWQPPIMSVVGTRVMVAHAGFNGTANKIGWFDISNYTSLPGFILTLNSTATATAATSVWDQGFEVGYLVNGPGLAGNTTITNISLDGLTVTLSTAALATGPSAVTVTGGNAGRPLWGAGDTAVNPLSAVPISVKQMNGRAYYGMGAGAAVEFSDPLEACRRTAASQAIKFANGVAVTALGELPLKAPLTGGVVQAIIAFQGVSVIQQITGDPTTSNLARNEIKTQTGTFAPISVISTNQGLAFMSPEGLRFIDGFANVSEPVGRQGQGICVPFINAVEPTRISGAGNSDTLRYSVQNGKSATLDWQEWWFDLPTSRWSGPHSFPASLISPWNSTFILSPAANRASLFQSDTVPMPGGGYIENGTPLTWKWTTALMPDNGGQVMNTVQQATLMIALPPRAPISIICENDKGSALDQVFIPSVPDVARWGQFIWGTELWGPNLAAFLQRRIAWNVPLVFKQGAFDIVGASAANVQIGNFYFVVQPVDYVVEDYLPPNFFAAPTDPLLTEDGQEILTENGVPLALED